MKRETRLKPFVQRIIRAFVAIPPVLRFFNPNYSRCQKCGLPWNWCESKIVKHAENWGVFATCQICWDNSTLEQLKKYYTQNYYKYAKLLADSGYEVECSLEHTLQCVEDEYLRTRITKK